MRSSRSEFLIPPIHHNVIIIVSKIKWDLTKLVCVELELNKGLTFTISSRELKLMIDISAFPTNSRTEKSGRQLKNVADE